MGCHTTTLVAAGTALEFTEEQKPPLTQQKICLVQVGGTEEDQCSIHIYSVLSTIHPLEAT